MANPIKAVKKIQTAANRNNKLERKMARVGAPPGYKTGMGSKVKGGKETAIVVELKTGRAAKIKGPMKSYKENVAKAVTGRKYESPDKFRARKRKEKLDAFNKIKLPKVPVKRRGK